MGRAPKKKLFTEQLFSAMGMLSGTRKPAPALAKKAPSANPAASHHFQHPELGNILLAVSRKAKRITLTIKPDGTVRLCVPYGTPVENGLKFLELKKGWALRTLAKYDSRHEPILPPYRTRSHELVLTPSSNGKLQVNISEGLINVTHPAETNPSGDEVQQVVKRGICEAMRKEAKELLPPRLKNISEKTGLCYRSVTIRNTVSKWGSCSARNDISLSLHLMRLPDHLIDYILIHELCHTVHKNHGPGFHELLDRLTAGHHASLRKELKSHHTRW